MAPVCSSRLLELACGGKPKRLEERKQQVIIGYGNELGVTTGRCMTILMGLYIICQNTIKVTTRLQDIFSETFLVFKALVRRSSEEVS